MDKTIIILWAFGIITALIGVATGISLTSLAFLCWALPAGIAAGQAWSNLAQP